MDINIANLDYEARLVTEKGKKYDLTNILTDLSWEEQEGQLAQKAELTVATGDEKTSKEIRNLFKLNRTVQIYSDWGNGSKKVFEGSIWDWSYQFGQQNSLKVTVYDPMVRLQQSKDHRYFSKGMSTQTIISDICGSFGVNVAYKWAQSIKHGKKVFRANTISDMIADLLDEVQKKKNVPYITLYRDGKLEINGYGSNKDVYEFGSEDTINTQAKSSMNKLVTRVKVLGKADDDGRSKVRAMINGNLKFGVLQEIVTRESDQSLGDAKAEAQTLISERGKPEESYMATGPDLPFLRKGDAVEVNAGALHGRYYVLGVSHNAISRQMSLTLKKAS